VVFGSIMSVRRKTAGECAIATGAAS